MLTGLKFSVLSTGRTPGFTAGRMPASTSTFGNSQRCAFTTPAGRCRTRKRPFRSATKATKRRAVAASRLPRFGNSSTRFSRNATQSFLTGQIPHCGFRGVQTSAPSSIRDWLKKEHEFVHRRDVTLRRPIREEFRLTEFCAHLRENQFFRQLPKPRICFLLLRIFPNAKNPRQHADDVAVENRRRLVEGDAANRAGGVTANARQRQNVIKVFRELETVSAFRCLFRLHNLLARPFANFGRGCNSRVLPKACGFCPGWRSRQTSMVGNSRIQRSQYGMTVLTWVCWSMISETQMA